MLKTTDDGMTLITWHWLQINYLIRFVPKALSETDQQIPILYINTSAGDSLTFQLTHYIYSWISLSKCTNTIAQMCIYFSFIIVQNLAEVYSVHLIKIKFWYTMFPVILCCLKSLGHDVIMSTMLFVCFGLVGKQAGRQTFFHSFPPSARQAQAATNQQLPRLPWLRSSALAESRKNLGSDTMSYVGS